MKNGGAQDLPSLANSLSQPTSSATQPNPMLAMNQNPMFAMNQGLGQNYGAFNPFAMRPPPLIPNAQQNPLPLNPLQSTLL